MRYLRNKTQTRGTNLRESQDRVIYNIIFKLRKEVKSSLEYCL